MEPDQHNFIGAIFTFFSMCFGMMASIIVHMEILIRCGAGAIAFLSGIMAIRYYYYAIVEKRLAIQEKKLNLDKLKNDGKPT